jgi:hypothetical protein
MAVNPNTPAVAIKVVEALMSKLVARGVSLKKIKKIVELVGKKTGTRIVAKKEFDDLVVTAMKKGKAVAKGAGMGYGKPRENIPHSLFFADIFKKPVKGYSIKKSPTIPKIIDYITQGAGSKQAIQEARPLFESTAEMRNIVEGLLFARNTGGGLN